MDQADIQYTMGLSLIDLSSRAMPKSEGVKVAQNNGQIDVSFQATLPDPSLWEDPGWTTAGPPDVALPTFTRPIPKKKPVLLPAELNTKPLDARQRWARDGYRFTPY